MKILPSTLEYSTQSLEKKLATTASNPDKFSNLQKSEKVLLHLDIVMSGFAKDRSVMKSLGLETNLDLVAKYFKDQPMELSIHLMGDSQDLSEVQKFLNSYTFKTNWQYIIFIPRKILTHL
jgi:hypothetical protein